MGTRPSTEPDSVAALELGGVVVVDAESSHGAAVCAIIKSLATTGWLCCARDQREATACFQRPVDLVFVDAALANGGALAVVDMAFRQKSSAIVVAMGHPDDLGGDVFALAKAGVHAYLPKPLAAREIRECLTSAQSGLAPIRRLLRPYVGRFGLKDIQTFVRQSLVREALERTGGSRRSAARVLGVTRPAVQRFLRQTDTDT